MSSLTNVRVERSDERRAVEKEKQPIVRVVQSGQTFASNEVSVEVAWPLAGGVTVAGLQFVLEL